MDKQAREYMTCRGRSAGQKKGKLANPQLPAQSVCCILFIYFSARQGKEVCQCTNTMAMANVVAAAVAAAATGGTDTGAGAVAGGASKTAAREYCVDISDAALGLRLRLRPPGKRAGSARVHDLAQVSAVRRAGVKRGDVLLEVNGSSMRGLSDMSKAVRAIKESSRPITLKFRRPREGADPDESDDEGADDGDMDPPLKDDPVYAKYWKMLKVGLPLGAVMNACERDSVDPTVMELDPNKSLASQRKKENDKSKAGDDEEETDTGPPLKDDLTYGKYFKMLKVGLPVGAVKNALARDGLDQGIIDLDPEKSLASQQKKKKKKDTGPPLQDDPLYSK
jgi:membrane-associated protease RseP (regulator of RpoE activity)